MKTIFRLYSLFVLFYLFGCAHEEESSQIQTTTQIKKSSLPTNDRNFSGCQDKEMECEYAVAPVMCKLHIEATERENADTIYAWAENPCEGRKKINELLCERKILGNIKANLDCIPDSTEGMCPITAVPDCDKNLSEPTECTMTSYNDAPVGKEFQIAAKGSNKCFALYQLQIKACQQNLNPNLITNIECHK